MKIPDQDDLAWDLLDAVRPGTSKAIVHRVSITLVNRDYPAVIKILVAAAVESALPLSAELLMRLDEWARFYPADPEAEGLFELLAAIRRCDGDGAPATTGQEP
jgi:hypothetical protein